MPRPTPSPFVEALVELKSVLKALNVGWYLFGAQAALIYGSSRATTDLDVTVQLGDVSTKRLASALRASGFALRFQGAKFVEQTRVLPIVHQRTDVAADLVLGGPGLEELFLERSRPRRMGNATFPVACLEDIVAMKILAGRAKDRDDIVDILRANQRTANHALIRVTLTQLETALAQDDLLPAFETMLTEATQASRARAVAEKRPAKKRTSRKRASR